MRLVSNGWGSARPLSEYNHCHNPSGSKGGQFCAAGGDEPSGEQPWESVSQVERDMRKNAWVDEEKTYAGQLAAAAVESRSMSRQYGESGTKTKFYDPHTGGYTTERQALHEQIIRKLLNSEYVDGKYVPRTTPFSAPTDRSPVLILMGGMTAAGKTTASKGLNYANKLYINTDDIKAMLPEWNGRNAAALHEESSDLAERVFELGRLARYNMVLDSTMKSLGGTDYTSARSDGGAAARIERMKNEGYRVEVRFVDVSVKTSLTRSINRYIHQLETTGTGRYVPVEYIKANYDKEYGTLPRRTFEQVKSHVHAYSIWNNDGAGGAKLLHRHGTLTEVASSNPEGGEMDPPAGLPVEARMQWRGDGPVAKKDRNAAIAFAKRVALKLGLIKPSTAARE